MSRRFLALPAASAVSRMTLRPEVPGKVSALISLVIAAVWSIVSFSTWRLTATGLGMSMREMVEEADAHLLTVIQEMREAADLAMEHKDPGTADVFTRFVQIHEKHEWWLRDILEKRDGLTS